MYVVLLLLPVLVGCSSNPGGTRSSSPTSPTIPTSTDTGTRSSDPDDDGDGVTVAQGDCDDTDGDIHPGAPELCDGIDQDCDGAIDEDAIDATAWYADTDGDGHGDPGNPTEACSVPVGHVADDTDCDDTDGDIHPGAPEVCDGIDQDCDGATDEEATDTTTWYADTDGDGYGDLGSATTACNAPADHVADPTDCDDSDAGVNPAASELCSDGVDQNCDGADGTVTFEDATGVNTDVTSTFASGLPTAAARWTFPADGTLWVCPGDWYVHVDGAAGDFAITGTAGASDASLIGDGTSPVVVLTDSTVRLATLTVEGGAGGLVLQGGTADLTELTLSENVATDGAGLWAEQCTLTLERVTASGNVATRVGGGMRFRASDVTARDIDVSNNSAAVGGGIHAEGGTISLTDSWVTGNTATDGAGLALAAGGLAMVDTQLERNAALQRGGGLYLVDAIATLEGWAVENTALDGGGLYAERALLDLPDLLLRDNAAAGRGGGAFLTDVAGTTASRVDANTAGTFGGGLYLEGGAELTCRACTLTYNVAAEGGGAYVDGSSLVMAIGVGFSPEVLWNSATVGGGVRVVAGYGRFSNVLFNVNTATTGGALSAVNSDVYLSGALVVFNHADHGAGMHVVSSRLFGRFASFDNNDATVDGGGVWSDASLVRLDDALWSSNDPADLYQVLDGPYTFPAHPTPVDVACDSITCTW